MDNKVIVVKQLPIIEERLLQIKSQIQEKVSHALSLACTEETVKAVKETRSALNKEYQALENSRKGVKKAIMTPYEQFELIYKDCVSDIFRPADEQLKKKISEVEDGLKKQRKNEAASYFREYAASKGIDFLTFEQAGIVVTLSASKKSLKDKAKAFVDKVADDLALIDTQEHKAEILVEYKKSLNVSKAITTVSERVQAIEAERLRVADMERAAKEREAATKSIDAVVESEKPAAPVVSFGVSLDIPLAAPVAVPATDAEPIETADPPPTSEPLYEATFTITATKEKLKALKEFLIVGGYSYVSE